MTMKTTKAMDCLENAIQATTAKETTTYRVHLNLLCFLSSRLESPDREVQGNVCDKRKVQLINLTIAV